ncbi:AMP-binding protein [Nocardia crassostreae]|uniref:AMP-binding protein n=1 Tax=Nocardia crassostreae TaxID=53428 RepID=UPI000836975B|nr:AMP-binding protein [Nocardia crassostreae]
MTAAPDTKTPAAAELLSDFVEHWAEAKPNEVAIVFGDQRWTWAQWARRIRGVAAVLAAVGMRRGARIGFLDMNHPACLEVTFAAASLGVATVVVNWRLATDELRHVLCDSGIRLLFAGADLLPTAAPAVDAAPCVERVIVVGGDRDEYEALLAADPIGSPVGASAQETDTGLIMYSSGTTGRPKGVVLSQKALVAHTANLAPELPFTDSDQNLVCMPLFHVGGICYAFHGIRAGVPTIMTRQPDAASLIAGLTGGATHCFLVPPVIAGLLAAGTVGVDAVSKLTYLAYGAAPMPLPLLRQALSALPEVNFVQVYGQTELAGGISTLAPADHRDPDRPQLLLSAGKPMRGTEVRVVNLATGTDVPAGTQGELWFRTEQAMTGYLDNPEATAETITPDGWLRTGDIGRLDLSGHLYIEDRIKDMVITGGENVYGPEVERVLLQHPAITDAAVIGVPDDHWGESVKAIVVANTTVAPDAIIAYCRDHLAGYKCPRTVDFREALPRNASGKILKLELRKPHWENRQRRL